MEDGKGSMAHGAQRLIVVTGASKGVGRATAHALVETSGATVIAVSRDAALLEGLTHACSAMQGRLETVVADLTAASGIDKVVRQVGTRRLHGLVNNAGVLIKRSWGEWSMADMRQLFELNASVPLMLSQALTSRLEGDPPGHIVNIGSMGGFQGSVKFPGMAGYSASKAALANLAECLAEELKDRGIRCNCLCLGAVDTEMMRAAFPDYQAPVSPERMGDHIARFVLEGHNLFNGKVLPLAISTP